MIEEIIGIVIANVLALAALIRVMQLKKRLIRPDKEAIAPSSATTVQPAAVAGPDAMAEVRKLLGGEAGGKAEERTDKETGDGRGDGLAAVAELPKEEDVVEQPERMEVNQNSNRPQTVAKRGRPSGSAVRENRGKTPKHRAHRGRGRGVAQKSNRKGYKTCVECGEEIYIPQLPRHMAKHESMRR